MNSTSRRYPALTYAHRGIERAAAGEQGGKYVTRFPPEPNGYLHIGHAKAMNFNFGQARIAREQGLGGETIMRFDDTNPAAEKQEYIDSILANVKWLGRPPQPADSRAPAAPHSSSAPLTPHAFWRAGNQPVRVTYSSDYFKQLYDFAVQVRPSLRDGTPACAAKNAACLSRCGAPAAARARDPVHCPQLALQLIKQGDAYVCHQTKDEVKAARDALRTAHIAHATEAPPAAMSPWRYAPEQRMTISHWFCLFSSLF